MVSGVVDAVAAVSLLISATIMEVINPTFVGVLPNTVQMTAATTPDAMTQPPTVPNDFALNNSSRDAVHSLSSLVIMGSSFLRSSLGRWSPGE